MTATEKPRWMDLNTRLILTIGLCGAIIVFGLVIPGLKALLATIEGNFQEAEVFSRESRELIAHRADDQMRIASYSWVDQEKGIVQIPIDRAMQLYVQRANAEQ